MDLTAARARVTFNINRVDQTTITAEVDYWLNAECRRWHERAVGAPPGVPHPWSFLIATSAITTVASIPSSALPTDFLRPVRLTFTIDTAPVRAILGNLAYLQEKYTGATEAAPSQEHSEWAVNLNTRYLYIFPTPDDAYSATLYYLQKYTDLVNGTDTNVFLDRCWDGIVAGATARGLKALKQYEASLIWTAEAREELQAAVMADGQSEEEGDLTLWISTDVHGTAQDPRSVWGDETIPPLEESW